MNFGSFIFGSCINKSYFYITVLLPQSFLRYPKFSFVSRPVFKCNNYPEKLIDQCVKTFLNKISVPKRAFITVPKRYF